MVTRILLIGALVAGGCAEVGNGPPVEPEHIIPITAQPVPSGETRSQAAGWRGRSWEEQVEDIRLACEQRPPSLVLIGDSITQGWSGGGRQVGGAGAAARKEWLEPHGPIVNAGISGDRTQHVLWRLQAGMLDAAVDPTIVLMIGTNNLPHDEAEAIAVGVGAILDQLRFTFAEQRIVLLSVPPRGKAPDDPLRVKGRSLNARLQQMAKGARATWLDLDPILLDANGQAHSGRMARDAVHWTAAGYAAVGEALSGVLGD